MPAWTSVWMFGFYCSCCWSHPLSLKPWISHSVSRCLWIIGKRPTWTSVWMFGFHCNCCCCCSLSSLKAAFSLIGWLSANHRLLLFSHLLLGFWTGCTYLQLCKKISRKLPWLLPPRPLSLCVCVSSVLDLKQGSHLQCRGDHTLCASISRDHVVCTDC